MSIDLHNMDCMDLMAKYPNKHFDLAIVDPPYGIGMDGGNVGYKGFNNFEKKKWDAQAPDKSYFEELFRVSKNQIIWGGELLWFACDKVLFSLGQRRGVL